MQVEPVFVPDPWMPSVADAQAYLNSAYNLVALNRADPALLAAAARARLHVGDARSALAPAAGHDGPHDACIAARAVLPQLDRALALLDALGQTRDPAHIDPLLAEIGGAMDRVELVLGAAGWD